MTTAAADTTGQNAGNLTNLFAVAIMPLVNVFEVWHMTIKGAPVAASANITIHNALFSVVTTGINGTNEWDPTQPALLRSGDDLAFLWALAVSVTSKPIVTIWPRFDADLPANRYPMSIALGRSYGMDTTAIPGDSGCSLRDW